MSTAEEILRELESLGSAQTRKTYMRHGAREPLFGVSYANFGKLAKRIKKDHALAAALWESGNYDARVLATMIADPQRADEAQLEAWAGDLDNHGLTDALVTLASKTPMARQIAERWIERDEEFVCRAGWHLIGQLALHDQSLPDGYFEPYVERIARDIHTQKNRVREAMNNVLIAIGTRSDGLEQRAIAAAERIGKVHVDHGDTSCKTPDAIPYIRKARARQQARAVRA